MRVRVRVNVRVRDSGYWGRDGHGVMDPMAIGMGLEIGLVPHCMDGEMMYYTLINRINNAWSRPHLMKIKFHQPDFFQNLRLNLRGNGLVYS